MSTMSSFCVNGRQLPSLFLVGAQKCGTTSMFSQLAREWGFRFGLTFEDNLAYSSEKEHHFFDIKGRWQKGLDYYATSFPPCGTATLDATPNYMHTYRAAERLREMYGEWRTSHSTFVFLLCDPVQRAQSAFCESAVQQSNVWMLDAAAAAAPTTCITSQLHAQRFVAFCILAVTRVCK